MRLGALALPMLALGACAAPPAYTPTTQAQGCRGEPVETQVSGTAIMGAGSGGFETDADVTFSTRVTPGAAGCTTVGGRVSR